MTSEEPRINIPTDRIAKKIEERLQNSGVTGTYNVVLDLKSKASLKMFHDRFICTDSRVFSIGRGLDILDKDGEIQPFLVYYCGRRRHVDYTVRQILEIPSITHGDISPKITHENPEVLGCPELSIHFKFATCIDGQIAQK